VMELMSGDTVINKNVSANILRSKFYVCPVCANVIRSVGETFVSCCGVTLPPLEAEEPDDKHTVVVERVEDEYFITVKHDMSKSHFISFMAYLTSDREQFVKLYPEGNAETRFKICGKGILYIYCNKHGLMKIKI
ncbi:MAG: XRE family transcriptional regulator, partial [Clostridia bacterium]|nr:XRE family transcriptional regulator [Clostridia bacterium]